MAEKFDITDPEEFKQYFMDNPEKFLVSMTEELSQLPDDMVFCISEAVRLAHQKKNKDSNVKRLRKKSGSVNDKRLLVAFLYVLMRDVVPPGVMEGTLLKLSNSNANKSHEKEEYILTNGYLAKYAQDIADRLETNRLTGDAEQSAYPDPFKR